MCFVHDWNATSQDRMETAGFCECLAGKVFPWDTHKTFCFAELSYLIHTFCTHTIYTPITHICWCSYSERKTLREVSTIHPLIRESCPFLERNLCSLFSFPFPLLYLLRGDFYLNTTHTHSKCWECFWCYWEVLEEAKDGECNMELVAGFGELDKTRFREILLE